MKHFDATFSVSPCYGYELSLSSDLWPHKNVRLVGGDASQLWEELDKFYPELRKLFVILLDRTPAERLKALVTAFGIFSGDKWSISVEPNGKNKITRLVPEIIVALSDADEEYYMDAFWRMLDSFMSLSVYYRFERFVE